MIYIIIMLALSIPVIATQRHERISIDAVKTEIAQAEKLNQYVQYHCARCGELIYPDTETIINDRPYCMACIDTLKGKKEAQDD